MSRRPAPTATASPATSNTNSAAALDGSIALVGARYVLILRALDCAGGKVLASSQAEAKDKSGVLDALGKLASHMRVQLGESLRSVERYDTPLMQATTPSLEALQSYSLGLLREEQTGSFATSLPYFQWAVELDPNFASAYLYISDAYSTTGEIAASDAAMQKAFDLRAKVSEKERLLIEGDYNTFVTGDVLKAHQLFQMTTKLYRRASYGHNLLADTSNIVGDYAQGLEEYISARRVNPANSILWRHVAFTYLLMDRPTDTAATIKQAEAEGVDSDMGPTRYALAFYHGDATEMERQAARASGKMDEEDLLLAMQADTAAYFGRLSEARELSRRAKQSAERARQKETAVQYEAVAALREALFGNAGQARDQVQKLPARHVARDTAFAVALALAYAGEVTNARIHADELATLHPEDTVVQYNYLPALRAKLALARSDPALALQILEPAVPYELGLPSLTLYNWPDLYPAYVRGEAYLASREPTKAAAEFKKILDHRGIVLNEPIGILARLQRARALRMSGEAAHARLEYQAFLEA